MRDGAVADLAALFHIRPWETDDLKFIDLARLVEVITQLRREPPRG